MPDITTANITFPANGAAGTGYLARPDDAATHPGVIVIQEWWGLDGHIRDIAERFAREGFVALAPDLYHGAVATEPDEARKLVMNMNREQAVKDLLGVGFFLILCAFVVFFIPDFFGYFLEKPNFEPANPMATPEHIAPVWYFTPQYAMLRAVTVNFLWIDAKWPVWLVIAISVAAGVMLDRLASWQWRRARRRRDDYR